MEICILRKGNSLRTEQNVTEHQEANELMRIRHVYQIHHPIHTHTHIHKTKKDFDLMTTLDEKSLILQ